MKLNLERPHPVIDLLGIQPLMVRIVLCANLFVEQRFPSGCTLVTETGDAVNSINSQAEAISSVADSQLKWCVNVAFFPIPADKKVLLALTTIGQTVDQPGV